MGLLVLQVELVALRRHVQGCAGPAGRGVGLVYGRVVRDDRFQQPVRVRAAEVIGALCLTTDLGMGFPFEQGLQTTLMPLGSPTGLGSIARQRRGANTPACCSTWDVRPTRISLRRCSAARLPCISTPLSMGQAERRLADWCGRCQTPTVGRCFVLSRSRGGCRGWCVSNVLR